MRVAMFGIEDYEREAFEKSGVRPTLEPTWLRERLGPATLVQAAGHAALSCTVDDELGASVLADLAALGIGHIALRGNGYNHVDLAAAAALGIGISHVPDYSPHAIAEHAVALILTLARNTHLAYGRVRGGDLALNGLVGSQLAGSTVGVVGAGRVGAILARIMLAFDCRVLIADPEPLQELAWGGARYVGLETLLRESDIVSLHCPLSTATHHLLDTQRIGWMKPGAMLINTGRGALIDMPALLAALEQGRIGRAGIDVYESVGPVFRRETVPEVIDHALLARLARMPNVVITNNQARHTRQTLEQIARATLDALEAVASGRQPAHRAPLPPAQSSGFVALG